MNPVKRIKDYLEFKMHDAAWAWSIHRYGDVILSYPSTKESIDEAERLLACIRIHRNEYRKYMDKYHPLQT